MFYDVKIENSSQISCLNKTHKNFDSVNRINLKFKLHAQTFVLTMSVVGPNDFVFEWDFSWIDFLMFFQWSEFPLLLLGNLYLEDCPQSLRNLHDETFSFSQGLNLHRKFFIIIFIIRPTQLWIRQQQHWRGSTNSTECLWVYEISCPFKDHLWDLISINNQSNLCLHSKRRMKTSTTENGVELISMETTLAGHFFIKLNQSQFFMSVPRFI